MRTIPVYMLITVVAGSLAVGCTPHPTRLEMPEHFVELDEHRRGDYEVRGMSADGVVIGLRRHENLKNGSLAFWQKALENEFSARGYRSTGDAENIVAAGGREGLLMSYTATSRGTRFRYLVAMYVNQDEVVTVEAGGKDSAVKAHLQAVKEAMRSVR